MTGSNPTVQGTSAQHVTGLRLDFMPWEFRRATEAEREDQAERHRGLDQMGEVHFGEDTFVAATAAVFCERLTMGDRAYIGAHAYVTGEISMGADSTINPFAVVRGRITLGDGVRMGAHTSLLAFNHGMGPDQPVFKQPHTSFGITVGDDVWIGSNVIILDGVDVGSHAVIGAGAVVTMDVEEWAIMVGNPARKVRDRRDVVKAKADPATVGASMSVSQQSKELTSQVAAFAARARDQVGDILSRCHHGERFIDRPGVDNPDVNRAIRPWCDAIEISDLLLRRAPEGYSTDDLVRRLRSRQDKASGLIAPGDLAESSLGQPVDASRLSAFEGPASYHILCVGYALQVLGSRMEHPITAVQSCPSTELEHRLDALPWADRGWGAGSAVDGLGTACLRNMTDFCDELPDGGRGPLFTLMGWLTSRADPVTGMWGSPDPDSGWLQVVNGFYRLTRGTYAQFGLPLPYPEAAVRTVLTHAQDSSLFAGPGYNSCNILDVIHPLWLAGKQTDYGRAEVLRWAEAELVKIIGRWVDGQGFAFAPDGDDDRRIPGLQGTEMWLSVIWLLSDYLGFSDELGYRPRGVHRPEPALLLPSLGR